MSTVVPPGFDLTDPDILADRLPLDEFAYLRQDDPVFWNAQDPAASGHDDGGFWALTRHADVKAVSTARDGLVRRGELCLRSAPRSVRGGP